jgi:hypothetical protein
MRSHLTTTEQIATFPCDVQDRATEWVGANVDISTDTGAEWDATYDAAVLAACQDLAAIDAVNDAADAKVVLCRVEHW